MNKFIWTYEVVTSGLLHEDSLLVFADCTDTYLMCSPNELRAKYERFNTDIILGSELVLWPFDALSKLVKRGIVPDPYPSVPTPLRHGNTGHYAGRTRSIRRFFEVMRSAWEPHVPVQWDASAAPLRATETAWTWCCPTGARYVLLAESLEPSRNETQCFNDQQCAHAYFAAGMHQDRVNPRVVVDAKADLFLNAHKMLPRISMARGDVRIAFNLSQALAPTNIRRTQRWAGGMTKPCWIHCSGVAKQAYPDITRALMDNALVADGQAGVEPAALFANERGELQVARAGEVRRAGRKL